MPVRIVHAMDLLAKHNLREKQRDEALKKKLEEDNLLKKPDRAIALSRKQLTIIMFILLLIAVPYIIFSSEYVIRDSCSIMPGIKCEKLSIHRDRIIFEVHNYLKDQLNITLRLQNCPEPVTQTLRPNTAATYTFNCTTSQKSVQKEIFIRYVGFSGLPHDSKGFLAGKVRE
jgi:hypothetical protein